MTKCPECYFNEWYYRTKETAIEAVCILCGYSEERKRQFKPVRVKGELLINFKDVPYDKLS